MVGTIAPTDGAEPNTGSLALGGVSCDSAGPGQRRVKFEMVANAKTHWASRRAPRPLDGIPDLPLPGKIVLPRRLSWC